MGTIVVKQIHRELPRHPPAQQLVQAFFQSSDLTLKAWCGQFVAPMPRVNRVPEQVLHLLRPPQVRTLVNQALQVAKLMWDTQLVQAGRGVQLRLVKIVG